MTVDHIYISHAECNGKSIIAIRYADGEHEPIEEEFLFSSEEEATAYFTTAVLLSKNNIDKANLCNDNLVIKSKFKPGDEIFYIKDNNIGSQIIKTISIKVYEHRTIKDSSPIRIIIEYKNAQECYICNTEDAFASKEEAKKEWIKRIESL